MTWNNVAVNVAVATEKLTVSFMTLTQQSWHLTQNECSKAMRSFAGISYGALKLFGHTSENRSVQLNLCEQIISNLRKDNTICHWDFTLTRWFSLSSVRLTDLFPLHSAVSQLCTAAAAAALFIIYLLFYSKEGSDGLVTLYCSFNFCLIFSIYFLSSSKFEKAIISPSPEESNVVDLMF